MSGYNTEQKKKLIEYMSANSHKALTMEEIFEGISALYEDKTVPGRSTLYRLIHKMTEEGSVKKYVSRDSRSATYQLVECRHCESHLHMKCTNCGRLFHMDEGVTSDLLRQIKQDSDFSVDESETVLYGKCSDCKSGANVNKEECKNRDIGRKVVNETIKSTACVILSVLLLLSSLFGCGKSGKDESFDIVCTVFPIYEWVRGVVGEDDDSVTVSLIVSNGTDPHSYSPTPSDIVKISSCDLIVYVGGESDLWVSDVLSGKVNESMEKMPLLQELGDRCLITGHHHEEGEDHDHGENAYDEHIWLSLKNAVHLCGKIEERLKSLLPERAEDISKKAEGYIGKLRELDSGYERAVEASAKKPLIFADRFPFAYLTEDYDIAHFEAFSGCSADSEASFETVTELVKRSDDNNAEYILILESSSEELAGTIIGSTKNKNAEILRIDSMQSISDKDLREGVTYIGIMEKNLAVLRTALG